MSHDRASLGEVCSDAEPCIDGSFCGWVDATDTRYCLELCTEGYDGTGDNLPAASRCGDLQSMCVLTDFRNKDIDLEPVFTCFRRSQCTAAVSDDGTALGHGWFARVLHHRPEETDLCAHGRCLCNDGCPYVYSYRPAVAGRETKWVIRLKGGGGCIDDRSCAGRFSASRGFMLQPTLIPPTREDHTLADRKFGVFARSQALANDFGGWNQVYVDYCSSDAFSGDKDPDAAGVNIPMHGKAIVYEVVRDLLGITGSRYCEANPNCAALPSLADAESVLIIGASAGADGVRSNMDEISRLIRTHSQVADPSAITIKALADASWIPPVKPDAYDRDRYRAIDEYRAPDDDPALLPPLEYGPTEVHDASCATHDPGSPEAAFWCGEDFHLLHGGGPGTAATALPEPIAEDGGHLTRMSDGDADGADALFAVMAQHDGRAMETMSYNLCVETWYDDHDSCRQSLGVGYEGKLGLCFRREACTPQYCEDPALTEGACYGPASGLRPYCLFEAAVFPRTDPAAPACDSDAECGLGVCFAGLCVAALDPCSPCAAGTAGAAAGFECLGTACAKQELCTQDEIDQLGAYAEVEAGQCRIPPGCSPDSPSACPSGYSCVRAKHTPFGQAMGWGIRTELQKLAAASAPWPIAGYSQATNVHTAMFGSRYYTSRVNGVELKAAVEQWWLGAHPTAVNVAAVEHMGWPLRIGGLASGSLRKTGPSTLVGLPAGCAPVVRWAVRTASNEGAWAFLVESPAGITGPFETGSVLPDRRVELVVTPDPSTDCTEAIAVAASQEIHLVFQDEAGQAHWAQVPASDIILDLTLPEPIRSFSMSDDGCLWSHPDMLPMHRISCSDALFMDGFENGDLSAWSSMSKRSTSASRISSLVSSRPVRPFPSTGGT